MNCDEMKRLFNSGCYSYEKIKGGRFIINHTANELHIFNCIMLSKEINKYCNSINNKPNIDYLTKILIIPLIGIIIFQKILTKNLWIIYQDWLYKKYRQMRYF